MKNQFLVTLNEDSTVFKVEEIGSVVNRTLSEFGYVTNGERAWMLREDNAEDENAEYHSVRLVEFWD